MNCRSNLNKEIIEILRVPKEYVPQKVSWMDQDIKLL